MGSESCVVEGVGGGVSTVRSAETGRDSAGGSCCRGSHFLLGTGKFFFEFGIFCLSPSKFLSEVGNAVEES